MFILLNIKHFYMVELEHLPIAHFLLFYLHASRLTVNTEGPWWWPGGMGMEVNATHEENRKPRADAPRALVNTISCCQLFIVETWPTHQRLIRRKPKGRFLMAYRREGFRAWIATTVNRIVLHCIWDTWQEKNYKNSPLASEKRSVIWTVLGTRKRTAKVRDHMLGNCKLYFLCWRGDASLFYFLLWIETR